MNSSVNKQKDNEKESDEECDTNRRKVIKTLLAIILAIGILYTTLGVADLTWRNKKSLKDGVGGIQAFFGPKKKKK